MIKRFFLSAAIFIVLSGVFSVHANRLESIVPDAQIIIFTTQQYPVNGIERYPQATVYQIDAVNQLENMPAFSFKGSPKQAERLAKEFIQSPEFTVYEAKLKQGYEGLIKAFYLGVRKVPAIIFYVPKTASYQAIYGTTNIEQAISIFTRYQQQE